MNWKQPIPTTIPEVKGNKFAETVFQKILSRCRNTAETIYVGDIPIELERGQCITGREELARCFGLKLNESGRIQRVLNDLQKRYKLITKQKTINCSIVTVLNYDEWVLFEQSNNQSANNSQTTDRITVNTNKSVKNKKNEYIDKRNISKTKTNFTSKDNVSFSGLTNLKSGSIVAGQKLGQETVISILED